MITSFIRIFFVLFLFIAQSEIAIFKYKSTSPGEFRGYASHSDFIFDHGTHNSLSKQLLLQLNGFQEINALIHEQMIFIESTLRNPFTVINCAFSAVAELTAQFDSFYDKSVDLRSIQASAQAIIDNALKNKSLDAVALGAIYLKERAIYALSNLEKQHAHVTDILAEKVAIESYNKADHESLLELYDRHTRVKDQDLSRDKKVLKEIVEHYNLLEKQLYALKNSSFIERSCHYFNRIFRGKPSFKKTIEHKQKELKNCYASCVEQEKALGGLKLDAKILENRIKQQAYSPEYKQSLEQLLSTKAGQEISPEYAASIKKTLEEHGALAKTTHAFSPEARNFLEESGYNLEEFSTCVGNSFEQHAHTALCELVEKTSSLPIHQLDQELSLGKALPTMTLQEINGVWQEVEKVNGVWRLVPEAAESHLPALTQIAQNNVSLASQIYQAKSKPIALVGLEKAVSSRIKPGFIDISLFKATKTITEVLTQENNLCELIYAKAKPKEALKSLADVADRLIHIHPEVISEKEIRYLIEKYHGCKGFMGDADAPLERLLNVGEARLKVVKGKLETLQQVHDRLVSLKGTVFELQLAEKLERQGLIITEFGAKYWPDGKVGKKGFLPLDFDLATVDTLIEAKNRHFHSLNKDDIDDIIKILLNHKETANNIAGKKYLFVSGEKLPEIFKEELIKNYIDFREIIS